MNAFLTTILDIIVLLFELLGVAIIVYGAVYIAYTILIKKEPISLDTIRLELGRSIVLALEFFLAADIIGTVITPDYYSIGMLSILVIIRTILTYFLNQDLDRLSEQAH